MLYFSKKLAAIDDIDFNQVERLKAFKKEIRNQGIQEQYDSVEELKQKLMRQLTIVMRRMSVGPIVNASVLKEAKAAATEPMESPEKADSLPKPTLLKDDKTPYFQEYSEKSFVVCGDTLKHKAALSSLGGRWLPGKNGGVKGWMFAKRRLDEVASALDMPATINSKPDNQA